MPADVRLAKLRSTYKGVCSQMSEAARLSEKLEFLVLSRSSLPRLVRLATSVLLCMMSDGSFTAVFSGLRAYALCERRRWVLVAVVLLALVNPVTLEVSLRTLHTISRD